MSAMSDLDVEVNLALDMYVRHANSSEPWSPADRRQFIWAAVDLLEKLSGRKLVNEIKES